MQFKVRRSQIKRKLLWIPTAADSYSTYLLRYNKWIKVTRTTSSSSSLTRETSNQATIRQTDTQDANPTAPAIVSLLSLSSPQATLWMETILFLSDQKSRGRDPKVQELSPHPLPPPRFQVFWGRGGSMNHSQPGFLTAAFVFFWIPFYTPLL